MTVLTVAAFGEDAAVTVFACGEFIAIMANLGIGSLTPDPQEESSPTADPAESESAKKGGLKSPRTGPDCRTFLEWHEPL